MFGFVLRPLGLFSVFLLMSLGRPLVAGTTYTPYNFTTLAGGSRGSHDGTGGAAQFYNPASLAVDGSGNVYVVDGGNGTIRKITPAGVVTTLAGTPGVFGTADGTGPAAQFSGTLQFYGIDGSGNLYIANLNPAKSDTFRVISPGGVVTTIPYDETLVLPYRVAFYGSIGPIIAIGGNIVEGATIPVGSGNQTGSNDGTGSIATFDFSLGSQTLEVAVDSSGNIFVPDSYNDIIRKVTQAGVVTTLGGVPGSAGSADGLGASARFNFPTGAAVDGQGNIYIADTANNSIRVGYAYSPVAFTTQPASQTVAVGQSVTFTAAASGSPTYQWSGPSGVISGATASTLTLTNVQLSAAGAYSVTATVTGGSVTSNSATLTVIPLAAPSFTVNPVSVTIASGRSAAFSAAASGELAPTYQWNLNGTPISGATDPVLLVSAATSANAGSYTCTASNASGTVTSTAATLTVTTTSSPGYLVNLSARADIGTGNNILIGGYATGGTGTKQLLIRGVGPALSAFFGSSALATPQLTLVDGSGAVISSNLGWGTAPTAGPSAGADSPVTASLSLMNNTGAYPYQAGSLDTATLVTAPTGNGTAQVSGVSAATGIGLVEFYDADTTTPTSRLVNISARADVGTGNNILIGGFAIGGSTAETVLIRAVGPGLNDLLPSIFPLSSVLTQPVLTIYQGGTAIYSNTIWGGDTTEANVFPTVGAFNLVAGHRDSVLLISLPPGNYTAQVSGLNSGTGIALCEIYEVQ